MSKKAYCGIGKIPKKQKLGTMKECADQKQIRYWGVKKADPKMIEHARSGSKNKDTIRNIKLTIVRLRGKESRIKKMITRFKGCCC